MKKSVAMYALIIAMSVLSLFGVALASHNYIGQADTTISVTSGDKVVEEFTCDLPILGPTQSTKDNPFTIDIDFKVSGIFNITVEFFDDQNHPLNDYILATVSASTTSETIMVADKVGLNDFIENSKQFDVDLEKPSPLKLTFIYEMVDTEDNSLQGATTSFSVRITIER